ncbi:MAG: YtxH domain-containing protein [Prolixibacteraceae bacterium]|jgi:gas vesicle protein|nr:YtxH domain-containing protein [Prolixibacteraceae bacterium]
MSTGKVVLGVLAGAAAGALLGVLFAPHKGAVTRKKIVRTTGSYANGVKGKVKDLLDDITEKFEQVKEDISEFAEQKMQKNGEPKKEVKTT